jgi:hypothetical protein
MELAGIWVYITFGIGLITEAVIITRWLRRLWRFIFRK